MKRLREIKPVEDLAWFDQAEVSLVFTDEIEATPEQVFDVLADHHGWPDWFSPVKAVSNVGPGSGVGARRRVQVPPLTVDERFVAWDRPNRYTFTITAISVPVVRQMAEDWQLTETATGTVVTNVIAADFPRWARPFRSMIRFGMRQTTSSGVRELKERVESNQTK